MQMSVIVCSVLMRKNDKIHISKAIINLLSSNCFSLRRICDFSPHGQNSVNALTDSYATFWHWRINTWVHDILFTPKHTHIFVCMYLFKTFESRTIILSCCPLQSLLKGRSLHLIPHITFRLTENSSNFAEYKILISLNKIKLTKPLA